MYWITLERKGLRKTEEKKDGGRVPPEEYS